MPSLDQVLLAVLGSPDPLGYRRDCLVWKALWASLGVAGVQAFAGLLVVVELKQNRRESTVLGRAGTSMFKLVGGKG